MLPQPTLLQTEELNRLGYDNPTMGSYLQPETPSTIYYLKVTCRSTGRTSYMSIGVSHEFPGDESYILHRLYDAMTHTITEELIPNDLDLVLDPLEDLIDRIQLLPLPMRRRQFIRLVDARPLELKVNSYDMLQFLHKVGPGTVNIAQIG